MSMQKVLVSLAILFSLLAPIPALTSISSCSYTASTAGETYQLTANLSVSTGTCISITNTGINLDCNGFTINGTAYNVEGILAVGANNSIIHGCFITNVTQPITVRSSTNVTVYNNSIYDNTNGRGIFTESLYGNNTIHSNNFSNVGGRVIGIYNDYNRVYSNIINGGETYSTIEIYGGSFNNVSFNTIENLAAGAIAYSVYASGIYELSGGNNTFSNNNFSNVNYYAMSLEGYGNNTVSSNSFAGSIRSSVYLGTANGNDIRDNYFNATGLYYVEVNSAGSRIFSNAFNHTGYGVYLEAGSNDTTIFSNNFTRGSTGIQALYGSYSIFSNYFYNMSGGVTAYYSGNISSNFFNDTGTGVYLSGSAGINVSSNVFNNTGTAAFYLSATGGALLYNNTINGLNSTAVGIHLFNSQNNVIRQNNVTLDSTSQRGLFVEASATLNASYFVNNITSDNLINGMPVHYFDSVYRACPGSVSLPSSGHIEFVNCNTIDLSASSSSGDGLFFTFSNNSIARASNFSSAYAGVWVRKSSFNTTLSGLNLSSNRDGVFFDNVTNATLVSSFLVGNEENAVNITDAGNNTVSSNVFANAVTNVGVAIGGSDTNTIVSNFFNNNNDRGIQLLNLIGSASTNNTILSNSFNYSTIAIAVNQTSTGTIIDSNSFNNSAIAVSISAAGIISTYIRSNNFTNSTSYGIRFTTAIRPVVYLNSFKDSARYGIAGTFISANITGNSFNNSNTGINASTGTNSNISNNNFENSVTGIAVFSGTANSMRFNSLNNSVTGIWLSSVSSNTIFSNTIYNSTTYGILVNRSITGNNISSNLVNGAGLVGLYLFNSNKSVIRSNSLRNNNDGLAFRSSLHNNVSYNSISNSTRGVYVLDGRNNTLFSNSFFNSTQYAVLLTRTVNNTITSNFFNNSYISAYLNESNNTIFTANSLNSSIGFNSINVIGGVNTTISGNSQNGFTDGITLYATRNNTVTGNVLSGSGLNLGIHLDFVNNTMVQSNTVLNSPTGIQLSQGANNVFSSNFVNASSTRGIEAISDDNNTFVSNVVNNSVTGMILSIPGGSAVSNSFNNNEVGILANRDNVNLSSNVFYNNGFGVVISGAANAIVSNSAVVNSTTAGVTFQNSANGSLSSTNVTQSVIGLKATNSSLSASNIFLSNPGDSEFSSTTSNVTLTNLLVGRGSNGSVRWPNVFVNTSVNLNDSNFFVGDEIASLNDSAVSPFNASADIVLANIPVSATVYRYADFTTNKTRVLLDGAPFTPTSSSYNGLTQEFSFTVDAFSSYALLLASTTSLVQSASPASPQFNGTAVVFSCTYSNSSGAITGASVIVSLDGVNRSTTFSGGVYSYLNSSIPVGIHSWQCLASATGQDSQTGSLESYEIFPLAPTSLAFVEQDGSPDCVLVTTSNVTDFFVRLLVNSVATCDTANVKLNSTFGSSVTRLTPVSCASGIHAFNVSTQTAGSYSLAAFSVNTSYSALPATCSFESTQTTRRAFPDVSVFLVFLAAAFSVLLLRKKR